ncbi:MAG: hypothetical protein Q8R67_05190 [Rhodoferax sp.]|nr:hypothetical protein [Rhodoferax sp.]
MNGKTSTRVISCTADNVKEMAAVVKSWPELHNLVKSLQEQNLFPGLRGLRITLSGPKSFTAQGLGAVHSLNASKTE